MAFRHVALSYLRMEFQEMSIPLHEIEMKVSNRRGRRVAIDFSQLQIFLIILIFWIILEENHRNLFEFYFCLLMTNSRGKIVKHSSIFVAALKRTPSSRSRASSVHFLRPTPSKLRSLETAHVDSVLDFCLLARSTFSFPR